jgi:hypothetical protein
MHSADHTVLIALLAVGGAILAALIAAGSADIRQRRQLRHDRQLQDLAELRSVLDEATVAFEGAIHKLHGAFAEFEDSNRPDPVGDNDDTRAIQDEAERIFEAWRRDQYNDAMQKCGEARDRMIVAGQRIAIRIGDDPVVNATYRVAISLVIDTIRLVSEQKRQRDVGAQVSSDDFKDRNSELAAVRTLFVAQAVALVGSRLPISRKRKLGLLGRREASPSQEAGAQPPDNRTSGGGEHAKNLSDEPDRRGETLTSGGDSADTT